MKKQIKITFLSLFFSVLWLTVQCQKVSCEKKIFSLDNDKSYYGGFTYLEGICYDSTALVWYDTIAPSDYRDNFRMFKELIQYETHFSGILENFICRKYGRLGLPEEKHLPLNDRYEAWVLEVQFYYPYQCDTFINVVNRYQVTTTGHPTEEGAPVLYDTWDKSVFVFFDMYNFGDTGRDKLDIIRKRVMKLVAKY